jgi:hypothetical protein
MSEHSSPSGAPIWYIVRASEEVAGGEEIVAGPLSDKTAADRLAESFGPDHVVRSGAAFDTEDIKPADRVQPR